MAMLRSPEQSIQFAGALMIIWLWLVHFFTGADTTDKIAAIRRRVARLRAPGG
jgi:hypothetical protein